jgi:hypothetical protein
MNFNELRNQWVKIYQSYVDGELEDVDSPFTEEQLMDVDIQEGVLQDVFLPYYQEGGVIEPNDEDLYSDIEQYWVMNIGESSSENVNEENDWYQDVLFVEKFGRR